MVYFIPLFALVLLFPIKSATADATDALDSYVAKSAAVVQIMHKKAKKALVNAAQDNVFSDYFSAHDDHHKHQLKKRIDQISLNVQNNFHVEEMCLIDLEGSEISRIVGAEIADDLSNEEASAEFFAPSFALRPRSVFLSPIYMSPDVDKWVVAYVTPILNDEKNKAILHYEHGLDVFQRALEKIAGPTDALRLAVTEEGWIIWDKKKNISVDKLSSSDSPSTYFEQFQFGGKHIKELVDAIDNNTQIRGDDGKLYEAAYRKTKNWYLIALQTTEAGLESQVN